MYLIAVGLLLNESLQGYFQIESFTAVLHVVILIGHLVVAHASRYLTADVEVSVLLLVFGRSPLFPISGGRIPACRGPANGLMISHVLANRRLLRLLFVHLRVQLLLVARRGCRRPRLAICSACHFSVAQGRSSTIVLLMERAR